MRKSVLGLTAAFVLSVGPVTAQGTRPLPRDPYFGHPATTTRYPVDPSSEQAFISGGHFSCTKMPRVLAPPLLKTLRPRWEVAHPGRPATDLKPCPTRTAP